ncbi:MAG: hypothetical protein U0835_27050 [Isosphaeraceae bacterium]
MKPGRLRLFLFLLGLTAAAAGTPLRQSEAAADFARSLAEIDDGDVLEEVDGGVGDDAGDTIRADETHPPDGPAAPAFLAVSRLVSPAPCGLSKNAGAWAVPRPSTGGPLTSAWLQRFRF